MAITKEQLDVTLSAKSQAEQHIMIIERENLDLRSICEKHNIDVKEEMGKAETLYERENLGREREVTNRLIEAMLALQGFNREEIESVKTFARDGDQDKYEKAMKGMILRKTVTTQKEHKENEKEIEEITLEEEEEIDEAGKIRMVRSVPKPTDFPIGTKLIDPNL